MVFVVFRFLFGFVLVVLFPFFRSSALSDPGRVPFLTFDTGDDKQLSVL